MGLASALPQSYVNRPRQPSGPARIRFGSLGSPSPSVLAAEQKRCLLSPKRECPREPETQTDRGDEKLRTRKLGALRGGGGEGDGPSETSGKGQSGRAGSVEGGKQLEGAGRGFPRAFAFSLQSGPPYLYIRKKPVSPRSVCSLEVSKHVWKRQGRQGSG